MNVQSCFCCFIVFFSVNRYPFITFTEQYRSSIIQIIRASKSGRLCTQLASSVGQIVNIGRYSEARIYLGSREPGTN